MQARVGQTTVELVVGNIVEQTTDAIVNAAHERLDGGNGVDGWVHRVGGPRLLAACREIGFCATGDAVVTTGGALPCKFVIHAVGPVYGYSSEPASLLARAYRASLRRASELHLRSIAFVALSTGAFCYPLRAAATIAMAEIVDFVRHEPHDLELVRMVLYPREHARALAIHTQALREQLEFVFAGNVSDRGAD